MVDATPNCTRPAALIFREACKVHSSKLALICAGQSWTFERLWQEAAQVASAFAKHRSLPALSIASWSPNAAEVLIIQWGAILTGAQMMHFDPSWDAVQAQAALSNSRVDYLFVRAFHEGKQYPAMIKAMSGRCSTIGTVVTHGREARFERVLRGGWLEFLDLGKGPALPFIYSPRVPVLTFFGHAEHEAPEASVEWSLATHTRSDKSGRPICIAVPCWQPVGLSLVLYAHLCGRTIVLPPQRTDPAELQDVAEKLNCEIVVVPPCVARAARSAGLDVDCNQLRWISPTQRLAEDMDDIVQDIGLDFRLVSNDANLEQSHG